MLVEWSENDGNLRIFLGNHEMCNVDDSGHVCTIIL